MKRKVVSAGGVKIGGGNPIVLIAGPCVIEERNSVLEEAQKLKEIAQKIKIPLIFKSSYDKANRSSVSSPRGPGLTKGLEILSRVKEKFNIPVCSDVHCREEIGPAAEVLDVIQIPALLCRQTDILLEAGRSGKVINIKKGQFMAPWDMKNVIEKVLSTGNQNIMITERGYCFGYNNLVSDMRSLVVMKELGPPVIFDATHSVQLPGKAGASSGGDRKFVPHLARAAVGCGCDGVFLEVHKDPRRALCDGPNMLKMKDLGRLLSTLKEIDKIIKKADR